MFLFLLLIHKSLIFSVFFISIYATEDEMKNKKKRKYSDSFNFIIQTILLKFDWNVILATVFLFYLFSFRFRAVEKSIVFLLVILKCLYSDPF